MLFYFFIFNWRKNEKYQVKDEIWGSEVRKKIKLVFLRYCGRGFFLRFWIFWAKDFLLSLLQVDSIYGWVFKEDKWLYEFEVVFKDNRISQVFRYLNQV